MRIISGVHKGRRLQAPKKLPIRPTTDMAKEGLFNLLQHRLHLQGLRVLDLFAGSGNISYEFGSRGAESITAVDQHQGCVRFIQKTSKELALPIEIVRSAARPFLDKNRRQYDLIFADPPYDFEESVLLELIEASFAGDTLINDGYFILEHRPQLDFESHKSFLESRKYGSSVFSFFGKEKEEE